MNTTVKTSLIGLLIMLTASGFLGAGLHFLLQKPCFQYHNGMSPVYNLGCILEEAERRY